MNYFCV
jgi:hypothetical protein